MVLHLIHFPSFEIRGWVGSFVKLKTASPGNSENALPLHDSHYSATMLLSKENFSAVTYFWAAVSQTHYATSCIKKLGS